MLNSIIFFIVNLIRSIDISMLIIISIFSIFICISFWSVAVMSKYDKKNN